MAGPRGAVSTWAQVPRQGCKLPVLQTYNTVGVSSLISWVSEPTFPRGHLGLWGP